MTVYICGDSFGFSDHDYGNCWVDYLTMKIPVINLCRVSASNFQISLQVQHAIEQDADYIVYLATSSIRQDVALREASGNLLERYVDITAIDPSKTVTSYSISSLNSTTPFTEDQLAVLKLFHSKFFDLDMAIHQNELIIEGTLSKLVASKIPFVFDQGGFEHPKFGNVKNQYFKSYQQYFSKICLWDYVDKQLIHRPYYHITDTNTHKKIAEYYYKLINDKT